MQRSGTRHDNGREGVSDRRSLNRPAEFIPPSGFRGIS